MITEDSDLNPSIARLDRAVLWWFNAMRRRAWLVIVLAVIAAAFTLGYTIANIRINTDTSDMLSVDLPWRQAEIAHRQAFPQYADNIIVVLDGPTPDAVKDAARVLAARIEVEHTLFKSVYASGSDPFLRRHGLLFLSTEELQDLADQVARVQPFLARLAADQSLRGLFDLLSAAVTNAAVADLDIGFALSHIANTLEAAAAGRREVLSWEALMTGKDSALADRQAFIVVSPQLDFGSMLPGEAPILRLRALVAELDLAGRYAVRARLTGAAALAYEELQSVSLGAQIASVGSFLCVGLVMLIGLRSVWLTAATLAALLLGLVFTAGFATFAVGELNLISVGFAVMYIGLGADYALYLCLRYKEITTLIPDYRVALREAVWHVGSSLAVCTLATSIGFFAFIPTDYTGVAQLGIISGAGMFISLMVTILVLPALLILRAPRKRRRAGTPQASSPWTQRLLGLPLRRPAAILTGAALVAVAALAMLPRVQFDFNPLNLQDPHTESVQTYRELLATSERPPWSITLLATNASEAAHLRDALEQLESVNSVQTVASFEPGDQEEKLAIIADLALTLGVDLEVSEAAGVPTPAENLAALERFSKILAQPIETDPKFRVDAAARALHSAIERSLAGLAAADPAARDETLARLGADLLGALPGRLAELADSLQAEPVEEATIPAELRARWVSASGLYRIEVFPHEDVTDRAAMERFVAAVTRIAPAASGYPVVYVGAGQAVTSAFKQSFIYALVAIVGILMIAMRHRIDALLVLLPLLLAALLTSAATVVFDIPFNLANVIALPLLLGMGVDNGIHMVHRFRTAPPADGMMLNTSTAKAVVLSAFTNISGFGNFAMSPHAGTASMGVLLTIGIVLTLGSTMIVLPSLLSLLRDRGLLEQDD